MEANKVVVIAGATSPSGKAIARRFLKEKASLALFSRDQQHLTRMCEELALNSRDVLLAPLDFRQAEAAQEAANLVKQTYQRCDVLINLVGGWIGGKSIEAFDLQDYATMLDQHFWTTLHLVRAFLPLLRLSSHGRVLIVSSPSAALPPLKSAPYAVAKAAQETLLLALAQETKGTSITANILRVSTITTESKGQFDSAAKTPLSTTPEEISEAIFFLCSEAAQVIHGARIPLYGSP